jgi:hypothetical protein
MADLFNSIILNVTGATIAHAQTLQYFLTFTEWLRRILVALIPVLIGLGLVLFIWGLVQFIFASGDEAAVKEGKQRMIWGIIALFVIVAVWGLVNLMFQLTGVDEAATVNAPNTDFLE